MFFKKNYELMNYLTYPLVQEYINLFLPEEKILKYQIMPEGQENISIFIKTYKQSYILKISSIPKKEVNNNENVETLIEREHSFMSFLRENNVNVPKLFPVLNSDKTYVTMDFNQYLLFFTLMEYIDGQHPNYTAKNNIVKICELQSELHRISCDYNPKYVEDSTQYSAMSYRMVSASPLRTKDFPKDLYKELYNIYQPLSQELKDYYNKEKKFIIHSDLKSDNIIFSETGEVYLIDFGDIRKSVPAEDLGVFIWDMCNSLYDNNLDLKTKVFEYLNYYQGYNSNFNDKDKLMAINYAIDRYLIINLHYLVENQIDMARLKYQIDKASKQLKIIENLLKIKEKIGSVAKFLN